MKDFAQLSPEDKIEAILAASTEPVPKGFVIDVAELDIQALNQETARRINDIFDQWQVQDNDDGEGVLPVLSASAVSVEPMYLVPLEQQTDVLHRINCDIRSTKKQIGRIALQHLRSAASARRHSAM